MMCTAIALHCMEEKSFSEERALVSGTFSSEKLQTSTKWLADVPAMR